MVFIPKAIDPTPVLPSPVSLLTSAPIIDEPDDRWEGGITWKPEPCAAGVAFDPCEPSSLLDASDDQGSVKSYRPFGVAFSAECSTFSEASHADTAERARRKLIAGEAYRVEAELERGAIGVTFTPDNDFLADGTATLLNTGTATTTVRAFADLESYLGDCRGGGRGYIHATIRTVDYWIHHGLVHREGGLLVTALGNIVVAGAGYDGPAYDNVDTIDATGNTAWAFATGQVEIRRSEIKIEGPNADQVNVHNNFQVLASRLYAVTFDDCCHAAIKVENCTAEDTCTPGA